MTDQVPDVVPGVAHVVIADDNPDVRDALSTLIEDHPHLTVVGVAETGDDAAELCARHHPELAVVDVAMPTGGAAAVRAIHAVRPRTIVAAYTAHADRRTRARLLEAGAARVFAKGSPVDLAEELHQLTRPRPLGAADLDA